MLGVAPPIYTMPKEEIEELLFGKKNDSLPPDIVHKYEKLSLLLKKFPIKKRKICLIQPPGIYPDYVNRETAKKKRYTIYFPYGLLSLSSAVTLFHSRWEVIIKDLFLDLIKRAVCDEKTDFDSLLRSIPEDCDVYGISYMQYAVERQVLEIADYLRSKGKFVIMGGVQCTNADPVGLLKENAADICFKRESETQLIKLLNIWEETSAGKVKPGKNYNVPVNLVFNVDDEIVSFDETFESIVSLDIRQEYEKIPLDDYHQYGSAGLWARTAGKGSPYANIMSNRGCRGKCEFCSVSYFMKRGVRARAAQDVLDEIEYLYYKKNVRHIEWLDDDLLGNRKRSLELFDRLADLQLDLTWSTNHYVMADSITEELAQVMVNSGCVMIGFGVETGNSKRMESMGKKVSKEIVRNAVNIFRNNHPQVTIATTWMFGFPGETFGELFDSFNFARELKVDWCTNSIVQPLPGTDLYKKLNPDKGLSLGKQNKAVYTVGRDAVEKGDTFDDRYKEIIDFRAVDENEIASMHSIQQFQIYFNVFVNLLGSINLTAEGNPEKIKRQTEDILKGYEMDAVAWLVNARANKMLGHKESSDTSMRNFKTALPGSSFWTSFFKLYEIV